MDKKAKEGGRWGPREGPDSPPYRQALAGDHDRAFSSGPFAPAYEGPRGLPHVTDDQADGDPDGYVDVRHAARPRVQADGSKLRFRDAGFKAVLLDPPYSDAYARNLYGVENPRPAWLLREATRVVVPGGRIGILHVALPFCPPLCDLVRVVPVSTGLGFRIRALTIYQRRGDDRQGTLV